MIKKLIMGVAVLVGSVAMLYSAGEIAQSKQIMADENKRAISLSDRLETCRQHLRERGIR